VAEFCIPASVERVPEEWGDGNRLELLVFCSGPRLGQLIADGMVKVGYGIEIGLAKSSPPLVCRGYRVDVLLGAVDYDRVVRQ
jgi:hypothetical protein